MPTRNGTAAYYQVANEKLAALAKRAANVRGPAGDALQTLRRELGSILSETAGAVNSAAATAANRDLFPSGRADRIRAKRDEFGKAMAGRLDVLDVLTESVRGVLAQAATRPLSKHEELVARHDAAYIIQHAEDKPAALQRLAARDDAIGGLVAGPFGRLLAETHAPSVDADVLHGAMQAQHVQAALGSDDPDRRAAAEIYNDAKVIAQAAASAKATAKQGADDLGEMSRLFADDPREALAAAQQDRVLPVSDDGEDD